MGLIYKDKLTNGVYWVEIEKAGLRLLCGCPADIVKFLIKKKHIRAVDGGSFKTQIGPNAILLSDKTIQNRSLSNLSEFPYMHMFYFQGVLIPGHPNFGSKPHMIGASKLIESQLEYLSIGNYGVRTLEELKSVCRDDSFAEELYAMKLKFAYGEFKRYEDLLNLVYTDDNDPKDLGSGVGIRRRSENVFEIGYGGESCVVDLNLRAGETYGSVYTLPDVKIPEGRFVVVNTGLGDGWEPDRPCFSSFIRYEGRNFLVDVGPNTKTSLDALGLKPEDIDGVFQTHVHDDHFGGYECFWFETKKTNVYAVGTVLSSMRKKLSRMFCCDLSEVDKRFNFCALEYDCWEDVGNFEVISYHSPHPVETTIFMFRNASPGENQKYFAHYGDLSSFKMMDVIYSDFKDSKNIIKKIKNNYTLFADLKKLDIGGGLIHGQVNDFADDLSKVKALGHISRNLSVKELQIGVSEDFGHAHILIK